VSIIWSKSVRRFSLLLAALVVFAGLQVIPSALAATSVGVPGATPVPGDPLTGTGQVTRSLLSYSDLTTVQNPTSPVDNCAFAIPAEAAMPTSTFEGTLTLNNVASSGGFQLIPSSANYSINCALNCGQHMPPFTMDFVQNGSYLVPAKQGVTITHDLQGQADVPYKDSNLIAGYNLGTWNIMVEPGRCWSELADTNSAGSFSRCSVPFTLVAFDDFGHTSYGLLTFLYNASSISNVRYQVVNETDPGNQFNMWGQLSATYDPHKVANDLAIANLQATAVQSQMPIKPITSLLSDYPDSGINLAVFTRDYSPSAITVYGVVYKGVNYVGGCNTRFGTYPYCNVMRMTPNSTTKSIFVGLGLALLVKLYGPGILSEKISKYIPEMAANSNWNDSTVTFRDASNMASGVFFENATTGLPTGDELNGGCWICDLGYSATLQTVMSFGTAHPSETGTTWAYMNTLMFLLAQAETGYLQSKQGPNADLFSVLVKEVYGPIGLAPGLDLTRTGNTNVQTSNPISGRPIGAGSMYVTIDDIAKISTLFQNNGMANGTQLVDRNSMLSAMQRLASDTGVEMTSLEMNRAYNCFFGCIYSGGPRYSRAVWSRIDTQSVPGCNFAVTSFKGHGGIETQMMPNGSTYYMFADEDRLNPGPSYRELNKLSPMCAPTTTTLSSNYATIGKDQSVTFSATVNAPTRSWSPTGTVQFFDNGQVMSPNIALNASGGASFTTSALSVATHNITATYSPDLIPSSGILSSPAITKLTSACDKKATTCYVGSTAGMKVGDNIAMGVASGGNPLLDDLHTITALSATSVTWTGAYQYITHASGEPVWIQNTVGGGFDSSTSGVFVQTVQAEAVATTTTTSVIVTTTTLQPITTTTLKKTYSKTITCVKGRLSKKVTGANPKCPAGYTLKK